MTPATVALMVAFGLSAPAASQDIKLDMFVTGNDLLARCTESSAATTYVANYAFCRRYIYAPADFYATIAAEHGRPSCKKPGVTGQQIVDMVVKYLLEHPEDRHQPGNFAVIAVVPALMTACPR